MSCSSCKDDEMEAVELLDDYWFFQNLLRKKTGMLRSASDPYPSSSSMDEVFAQITNKHSSSSQGTNQNLRRTPSLPVRVEREKEEELPCRQESGKVQQNLTLPASIEPEKRSRSNTLSTSKALPPLRTSKNTSPGIPKHLARRQSMVEGSVKDSKPRTHNRSMSQNPTEESRRLQGWGVIKDSIRKPYRNKELMHNISKSPKQLEIEELQGFKDLGFHFDKLDINPFVADIIPGLQIKKPDDWNEGKVRRPYLSEAWLVHRPTPSIPDWIDPASSGDMKKQLKYWARAVASNMRQEC